MSRKKEIHTAAGKIPKPTPTALLRAEIQQLKNERDHWKERFDATLEGRLVQMEDSVMDALHDLHRTVNR